MAQVNPDSAPQPPTPAGPHDQAFLQVLAHHTMLRAYVLVIVRDAHLAEDALSEATLAIVHSWARFDQSLPFAPWARGVARRVALATLRKNKPTGVALDEDVLAAVGTELDTFGRESDLEERRYWLKICLEKLPGHSRDLVRARYEDELSYEALARQTGRTIGSLYKALSRIHEALARCLKASPHSA